MASGSVTPSRLSRRLSNFAKVSAHAAKRHGSVADTLPRTVHVSTSTFPSRTPHSVAMGWTLSSVQLTRWFAVGWVPSDKRNRNMPREENRPDDFANASVSKAVRAQIAETNKRIGTTALQAQSEFFKALEEMEKEAMSRAAEEVELGLKLSKKLTDARSVPDVLAAYREWLSEEIDARTNDARRFMVNGQKLMDRGSRFVASGWSHASDGM
jgi:hypothetical protein